MYYKETSEGRVIVLSPPVRSQEPAIVIDDKAAEVTIDAAPAEEPLPEALPETASPLPLIGLLGLLFVSLGAAVSRLRWPVVVRVGRTAVRLTLSGVDPGAAQP